MTAQERALLILRVAPGASGDSARGSRPSERRIGATGILTNVSTVRLDLCFKIALPASMLVTLLAVILAVAS